MSLYDDASLIAYPSGYKESKIYAQKPVPSYGAELVTNGDFATDSDWNKGSGSTISGGAALNIISATYNATTRQTISLTSGITYQILINATAVGSATANTFQLGFGDSSGNPSSTTQHEFAVGVSTKTLTVTASATDTTIIFRSRDSGTSNLTIHSVSVKEVLVATADLTFTRASSATRVNAEGLIEGVRTNHLLNTNTFSGWGLEGGTITGGFSAPDGSLTAFKYVQSSSGGLYSNSLFTDSSVKTLSIYIKSVDQTSYSATIGNGVNSGVIVANVTPTWQRISASPATATSSMSLYLYAIGNVGGVMVWHPQGETGDIATEYIPTTTVAVSVGMFANIPRIDYSNGCGSLLLEPQRTNLALYSSEFDNAAYSLTESSITANASTSPDGTENADKLVEAATSNIHRVGQGSISVTSGQVYTFSFYVKAAERDELELQRINTSGIVFNSISVTTADLTNGTLSVGSNVTASNIASVGDGWYRMLNKFNRNRNG